MTRIVQQQLAAAAANQQGQQQLLVGSQGQQVVIPSGQGQQVVNVSELLAQSQAAHKPTGLLQQGTTTIKIQGTVTRILLWHVYLLNNSTLID